jgi:hypothetical protein
VLIEWLAGFSGPDFVFHFYFAKRALWCLIRAWLHRTRQEVIATSVYDFQAG